MNKKLYSILPLWLLILYIYPVYVGNRIKLCEIAVAQKSFYTIESQIKELPPAGELPVFPELKAGGKDIRVMLFRDIKELYIACDGECDILRKNEEIILENDKSLYVTSVKKDITENIPENNDNTQENSDVIKIKPLNKNKLLKIIIENPKGVYSAKRYRGSLEICPTVNGKLMVVNQLSLNEYLAGVVPSEMPSSFPDEALKSQAIVARTYTLKHLTGHKDEGFDLCSNTHCQVYSGVEVESSMTNQAVMDTSELVVYYKDSLADTVYNSTCGGVTGNASSAWDVNNVDYLISVSDQIDNKYTKFTSEDTFQDFIDNPPPSYCQDSLRSRWEKIYTREDIEKRLSESLPVTLNLPEVKFGKLIDLIIEERNEDGRIKTLVIKGTLGDFRVEREKIRWLFSKGKIGKEGLWSTLFYIVKKDDNTYIFRGAAWGHGVGLCQYGAKGLADHGYKASEIIEHYYPGCNLGKFDQ